MTYEETLQTIIRSIRIETGYGGEITEASDANSIDGWDSIAHIRIMYRIEMLLGVEMDMLETYSASNIRELAILVTKGTS